MLPTGRSAIYLALATLLLVFLNKFPDWYAWVNTPPGMSYIGHASWFDPWDINFYVSIITSGQLGTILLENRYTTDPNAPVLLYPLYTIVGFLFSSLNPFLLFHLLGTLTTILISLGLYLLFRTIGFTPIYSVIALLATTLGGGIGFLQIPSLPSADISMTSFTMRSSLQRPHEGLAVLMYCASLVMFYRYLTTFPHQWKKNVMITAIALFIALSFYSYLFASFCLIALIFLMVEKKLTWVVLRPLITYVILPNALLITLLYTHLFSNTAFRDGILTQYMPTRSIDHIVLGYGIAVPILLYQLFMKKSKLLMFMNIWIVVSLVMAYLPVGINRYFLRGMFFPIVSICIYIVQSIKGTFLRRAVVIGFMLCFIATSLWIFHKRITGGKDRGTWYYLTAQERDAMTFLDHETPYGSSILAHYRIGNIISAVTDNRVYFGHLILTPHGDEKLKKLNAFYSGELTPGEALTFLKDHGIRYVYWGHDERLSAYPKTKKATPVFPYTFLRQVYHRGEVEIYAVM